MKPTRYGEQPAKRMLKDLGLPVSRAAVTMGVTAGMLVSALDGHCRPNEKIRHLLPKLLNRPVESLFTSDAIAAPPGSGRGTKMQCGCVCPIHGSGNDDSSSEVKLDEPDITEAERHIKEFLAWREAQK